MMVVGVWFGLRFQSRVYIIPIFPLMMMVLLFLLWMRMMDSTKTDFMKFVTLFLTGAGALAAAHSTREFGVH